MSDPILAKLLYLTSPEPGKHILNIQFQGDDFAMQIVVSKAQLGNLVADGAATLVRENAAVSVKIVDAASKISVSRFTSDADMDQT